jgi:TIR domain-containing protein
MVARCEDHPATSRERFDMPTDASVFISHISEDEPVADWLKDTLNRDFLGIFSVFVSSDTESVVAGEDWLESVHQALDAAAVLITLCSRASIERPWINFEVGAAWITGKPIIPVCHSDLLPAQLPLPLALRQGVTLADGMGIERLYEALARAFECRAPQSDFGGLADEARGLSAGGPSHLSGADTDPITRRLRQALDGKHPWRTLERVATEAGVSETVAADLLRADTEIRFGKGKSGGTIVGLVSRVGAR